MKRAQYFILLSLFCVAPSLFAQASDSQKNAEADFFYVRHHFVAWDSAAISQFVDLRNSRLYNSALSGASIVPFIYLPGKTAHTAKSVEIGISSAQGEGMVSAGPSRINFGLRYMADDPHMSAQSSTQSSAAGTASTRAGQVDMEPSARLRHYSLNYDHELYFAPASSSLYGLGLWLGLSADYDQLKLEQLRLGQSTLTSGSVSLTQPSFYLREVTSHVFSTPFLLGIAYRRPLTQKLAVDVRAGLIATGYAEGKVKNKEVGLSIFAFGSSVLPFPGNSKSHTTALMSGTGYRINLGLTYQLSESTGLRFHAEDRMVTYKLSAFKFKPDPTSSLAALTTAGSSGSSTALATALLPSLLPDLGPLPAQEVDRRRSLGLEFQYRY